MAYYNTCPWCGASLDPGESCDCKKKSDAAGADIGKPNNSFKVYHENGLKSSIK